MKKERMLQFLALAGLMGGVADPNNPMLITNPEMYNLPPLNVLKYGNNPVFIPRRTKFKGWMREKRRCTFNKNK